jgi:hypothetical protein
MMLGTASDPQVRCFTHLPLRARLPMVARYSSPAYKPGRRAACELVSLQRFLQLAGDFVGGGLHGALHDLGGLGQRPI